VLLLLGEFIGLLLFGFMVVLLIGVEFADSLEGTASSNGCSVKK